MSELMLGLHINAINNEVMELLRRRDDWPLIVTIDHSSDFSQWVKDHPDTKVVVRHVFPPGTQPSMTEWVDQWGHGVSWDIYEGQQVDKLARIMAAIQMEHYSGLDNVWYSHWNEIALNSEADAYHFGSLTWWAIQSMYDRGMKSCAFNFAHGNPRISYYQFLLQALQNLVETDGLLGLHNYSKGDPTDPDEQAWLIRRHGQVFRGNHEMWLDPKVEPEDRFPGLPWSLYSKLRCAMTESGFDDSGGWVQMFYRDEYINFLLDLNAIACADEWTEGYAIFQVGQPIHPQWGEYSSESGMHGFLDAIGDFP